MFHRLNRFSGKQEQSDAGWSDTGWMPVHYAALSGSESLLQTLLAAAADPNCQTTKADHAHYVEAQCTPLMLCCYFGGGCSTANLLLDSGAKVNRSGMAGNTALAMCAISGNVDCIRLLVQRRAAIDRRNLFDSTPLLTSVLLSRDEHVRLLLELQASVRSNKHNLNPLHHAALSLGEPVDSDIVRRLLLVRADASQRIRIPATTLLGLVTHLATVTYENGYQQKFEWGTTKMTRCTAAQLAGHLGNNPVRAALEDAAAIYQSSTDERILV